jgi:hypothetical protein
MAIKKKSEPKTLKDAFEKLGFVEEGASGEDQVYGTCPFCDRSGKFYLNVNNGLWDCKVCGKKGNLTSFLEEIVEHFQGSATGKDWRFASDLKKLPVDVLKESGMVWNGMYWILPVRNIKGRIHTVRLWQPKEYSKWQVLVTTSNGIWGLEALADKTKEDLPIYLCEGAWDALAIRSWLQREGLDPDSEAILLGTPGCETFKADWVDYFIGRKVNILYDNDKPGITGRAKVARMLIGVASEVTSIEWPDGTPEKYDVRDAYVDSSLTFSEFKAFWKKLTPEDVGIAESSLPEKVPEYTGPVLSFPEALAVYKKHLKVNQRMEWTIRVAFATVISTDIPGDPLWMYIVGPPGSAKTEILVSLKDMPERTLYTSTLTVHSLVSGFHAMGGGDPSLLPLVRNKCLVLKDFTEILSLNPTIREEIYSILRGAFDGLVKKSFGNGVKREYKDLHFSMLSGVTAAIDRDPQSNMGERFLRMRITGEDRGDVVDILRAAAENVSREGNMREELSQAARGFFAGYSPRQVDCPKWLTERLICLTQVVAFLRARVDRDPRNGNMLYSPEVEVGTRVIKQLKKLALGLAHLYPSGEEDWQEVWKIVRQVGLDSCIGFNRSICYAMFLANKPMTAAEISKSTGIPRTTLSPQLTDLELVKAVKRESVPNPHGTGAPQDLWSPNDAFAAMIKEFRHQIFDPVKTKKAFTFKTNGTGKAMTGKKLTLKVKKL